MSDTRAQTQTSVGGDNYETGDITNAQAIAIGQGATAIYQGLTIDEVKALFADWRAADAIVVWDGRTPYVGLNAFQESDAEFFFGRESLVEDLLARLGPNNFITISGPSGSGKSSVSRAGLFHALRAGRLERSDSWLLTTMQPRGNPLGHNTSLSDCLVIATRLLSGLRPSSPDGETIVSASADRTVRLWIVSIEEMLALAEQMSAREPAIFTPAERERYGVSRTSRWPPIPTTEH